MEDILASATEDFEKFYSKVSSMNFFSSVEEKMRIGNKGKGQESEGKVKKIFSGISSKFLIRTPDEMRNDIKSAQKGRIPSAGFGL